jgi:hypothetical protein
MAEAGCPILPLPLAKGFTHCWFEVVPASSRKVMPNAITRYDRNSFRSQSHASEKHEIMVADLSLARAEIGLL